MGGGPVPIWKKYTTGSKGIYEVIRRLLVPVPNRSSGNPYVPLYRVPPPGSNKEKYECANAIPATDIMNNEYDDRDTRRAYPKVVAFTQAKVSGLLKVGSQANSRLPKNEEGVKALEVVEQGKLHLTDTLKSLPTSVINGEVLGKEGGPIIAPNLNKGFKVRLMTEEESGMYSNEYPVRVFTITK